MKDHHAFDAPEADLADDDGQDADDHPEGPKAVRCAECRAPLRMGVDVIAVESGVIGNRGLVPLEERLLFCGDLCVRAYFGEEPAQRVPRRIP